MSWKCWVLAFICFQCWWNVIRFLRTVGYTGGRNPKPSYETVCGGDGHTEVSHQSGYSLSWLSTGQRRCILSVDLPRKCTCGFYKILMNSSNHVALCCLPSKAIQIEYDPEEVHANVSYCFLPGTTKHHENSPVRSATRCCWINSWRVLKLRAG